MNYCQKMKQNETASSVWENVYVCVSSWWVHVWEGFFDEGRVSFWGSVFYGGSKTWNGIDASESENESENGCGVCPFGHLSLFHETWVFRLSFGFSLETVLLH